MYVFFHIAYFYLLITGVIVNDSVAIVCRRVMQLRSTG